MPDLEKPITAKKIVKLPDTPVQVDDETVALSIYALKNMPGQGNILPPLEDEPELEIQKIKQRYVELKNSASSLGEAA